MMIIFPYSSDVGTSVSGGLPSSDVENKNSEHQNFANFFLISTARNLNFQEIIFIQVQEQNKL